MPRLTGLALLLLASIASAQDPGCVAQHAYLKASNTGEADQFGWSLAVSGDTLVVGAPFEDSSAAGVDGDQSDGGAPDAGAAYVLVRSGKSWVQQAYLKASNPDTKDEFGDSVAIDGDTIVVGAPKEDSPSTGIDGPEGNGEKNAGAAYVFVRHGSTWSQQAYLKASNTQTEDSFGRAVAVSGDTVIVGAPGEDGSTTGVGGHTDEGALGSGAAYVFERDGSTWSQQAYVKASNTGTGDLFGWSVAASDDVFAIGALLEDSSSTGIDGEQLGNTATSAGAVYVFARDGASWSQQAYVKATNTDQHDQFGYALALDGDTLAVGAWSEDSGATGVDGDASDDGTDDSGAAYVYVRDGTTWSADAYLKATNTGGTDHFGWSVDISGDNIVIGAPLEDSVATGILGAPGRGSPVSGASYVFARVGSTWTPQAYVKASNTFTGDVFGNAVGIDGGLAVVAARLEDSSATGVHGNQADDGADGSGAAYAFDVASTAWIDEGGPLPGAAGDPLLVGCGTLAQGSANRIDLLHAAPAAPVGLFVALSATPVPFKGGTLQPFPWLTAPVMLLTDASGSLGLPFSMPAGTPAGIELWLQAGIQDVAAPQGVALSNGVRGLVP